MVTFLYGYGTPPVRKSEAQLEQITTYKKMHPEVKRRLVAMFTAALADGTDLGFGGGWRSSAQQEALFRSRYHIVSYWTGLFWDGHYWEKNPNVAPSTPPYRSYHESTVDDCALAVDTIGDWGWLKKNCARFGFKEFSEVNNEPWHIQPVEVPNSRSKYDPRLHVLSTWVFDTDPIPVPPTPPTPPPSTEVGELMIVIVAPVDCHARFLGYGARMPSGNVGLLQMEWCDANRLAAYAAQSVTTISVQVSDLRNVTLLGQIPVGDPGHAWNGSEFARVIA